MISLGPARPSSVRRSSSTTTRRRKVKKVITDPKTITPTGKFNVWPQHPARRLLIALIAEGGYGRPFLRAHPYQRSRQGDGARV